MVYILLVAILALMGFNTYLQFQKKKVEEVPQKKTSEEKPLKPANELVKELLADLNCQIQLKGDKGNDELIEFDYQGGHFTLAASKVNAGFKLGFMYFYSTEPEHLERIRMVVNSLNAHTRMTRFTYSYIGEDNKIFVHQLLSSVVMENMPKLPIYWRGLLDSCFEHKRVFIRRFEETNDTEEETKMDSTRMLYLIREHEIAHQEYEGEVRMSEDSPYTLQRFLSTVMDMSDTEIHKIAVVNEHMETLTDKDAIQSYELPQSLLEGSGKEAKFRYNDAQLVLTLSNPKMEKVGKTQTVMLLLHAEQEDEKTLYFRVTYCTPAYSISKELSLMDKTNQPETQSILMAYDKEDTQEKRAEADYMWGEAISKSENDQLPTLSEEQDLLLGCTFTDDSYDLYWGKKAFMEKRYYEALFYLEKAFGNMESHFHEMKESDKKTFYDLCYYIGYCYNDIGQYKKGYYYLDAIFNQNRISYAQEYINGLTSSGDFRAMTIIETLLDHLTRMSENFTDEDGEKMEPEPAVKSFINFLRRRKAYIHVDLDQLDEAENQYKELLKDPESERFALHELAYIQNLKKSNA